MKKMFRRVWMILALSSLTAVLSYAQTFKTADEVFKNEMDSSEKEHISPENANVDSNGKVNRGSYLTNAFYDNWSFGLAGGIQSLWADGNHGLRITGDLELNIAKWITPDWGLRIGYQGFSLAERRDLPNTPGQTWVDHYQLSHFTDNNEIDYRGINPNINTFYQCYVHADFLLGLSNLIGGYKETRLVNVVPYFHAGYFRLSSRDEGYFNSHGKQDNEVAFGPGVLLNFRITNNWTATFDFRETLLSARYHDRKVGGVAQNPTISVGIAYTIKKWYFVRQTTKDEAAKVEMNMVQDALAVSEDTNKNLTDKNQELEDELARLKGVDDRLKGVTEERDELLSRIAKADIVLYYDINVDKLVKPEQSSLDKYVTTTLERDPDHVFYITGSADKGTGNEKINTRLSANRAKNVKNILMRKHNIPESRVVIKAAIISDKHADGRFDRCVIIESE